MVHGPPSLDWRSIRVSRLSGAELGCMPSLYNYSDYYGSIFVIRCGSYYTPIHLSKIFLMFLGFSRGGIRYVWISPGGKCATVAFLLGGNSHVLHFSRAESRMCCIVCPSVCMPTTSWHLNMPVCLPVCISICPHPPTTRTDPVCGMLTLLLIATHCVFLHFLLICAKSSHKYPVAS